MKNTKRGFTKIEVMLLVVAICAFAIVLITTYKQTRLSADCVAVKELNAALKLGSKDAKPETIEQVIELLTKAGYNLTTLQTLKKETYFIWDSTKNRILLVDGIGAVIYPQVDKTTGAYENLDKCVYFSKNIAPLPNPGNS